MVFGVKIAIAAALLAWVLSQVHWNDYVDSQGTARDGFATVLSRVQAVPMGLAVAGFLISLLIIACRWWLLLRLQAVRIGLWEAIRLTFLGQFFNYVVPGTVGGDLVKAYYVSKHTPRKAAVLVSVLLDRVLGLTELTLMATVMLVIVLGTGMADLEELRLPVITTAIVLAGTGGVLLFLLSRRFRRFLHLEKLYRNTRIARHVAALGKAARLYRRQIGRLAQAILVTFGAHVVWVGSVAMIGWSLSLSIPWYSYFLYIPLIYILGAVPITPGGIGLIEHFYLAFFAIANPSAILALALLARLIPMLWGLPGAWVAVTGAKLPKIENLEAEFALQSPPPESASEQSDP